MCFFWSYSKLLFMPSKQKALHRPQTISGFLAPRKRRTCLLLILFCFPYLAPVIRHHEICTMFGFAIDASRSEIIGAIFASRTDFFIKLPATVT